MKLKGCITKSAGKYTVAFNCDGKLVYKRTKIDSINDARALYNAKKDELNEQVANMRSFPELEGMEVDFINDTGTLSRGVIVGCDYWVGITIVAKKNSDRFLMCLRGPLSIQAKHLSISGYERLYKDYMYLFTQEIKALKSGVYDCSVVNEAYGTLAGDNPSQNSCAFGQ